VTETCTVCNEPFNGAEHSPCANCQREFHLATMMNPSRPDCGRLIYLEENQGFVTMCETCAVELGLEEPEIGPWTTGGVL
jgi:hypothetical protein